MSEKISTMEVRARLGEILNRVSLRHDEFIIERKGKPIAALVPIERLEAMRELAREHAEAYFERQRAASGNQLSDRQVMKLALEAQKAVRRNAGRAGQPRTRK